MAPPTSSGRVVIFIVSNIAPYGYEINSILGLPTGSYRFRYDQSWIAVKNPFELKNQRGIVVVRDIETAVFYPVRRVKVEQVTRVGDIYHFEYSLEDLIDLSSDEGKRKVQIEKFTDLLNTELGIPNKPHEYITKSVLISADHAHFIQDDDFKGESADRDLNSWGTIARILGGMKFYEDFDFFRMVKIIDEQGNESLIKKGKNGNKRYWLAPNTTYQIQVFQRALFSTPLRSAVERKRDLVLSGIPDEIISIRPTQHIAGKYDLLNFTFMTSTKTAKKDSFLFLEVKYENPSSPDLPPIPPIQIPIHISPLKSYFALKIINVFLFAGGVYLLFFTQSFLSLTGIKATDDILSLVQKVAILLMVVTSTTIGYTAKNLTSLLDLSISPFQKTK